MRDPEAVAVSADEHLVLQLLREFVGTGSFDWVTATSLGTSPTLSQVCDIPAVIGGLVLRGDLQRSDTHDAVRLPRPVVVEELVTRRHAPRWLNTYGVRETQWDRIQEASVLVHAHAAYALQVNAQGAFEIAAIAAAVPDLPSYEATEFARLACQATTLAPSEPGPGPAEPVALLRTLSFVRDFTGTAEELLCACLGIITATGD